MKFCCRFKTLGCKAPENPQTENNFAKDKKRRDGLTPHCKSCLKHYRETNKDSVRESIKRWRANNPEKMIKYRKKNAAKNTERMRRWREKNLLKSRYGITNEDWDQMFAQQKGLCAICLVHAKDLKRGLTVDHCHSSKKVRGLLCHVCNQAIGMFKESRPRLERALSYLLAGGA